MSSGKVRKASSQEIPLAKVQDLIKHCLRLYMSQKEVVTALLVKEKIEPRFTELVHQNSTCYAPENTGLAEKMLLQQQQQQQQPITTSIPNGLTSSCMQTAGGVVSQNFAITQGGVDSGGGVGIIKTESGSCYIFGGDGNVHTATGDAAGGGSSCFSGAEPTSTLLDADSSSFGYFDQISPNFSLSDLTADFSNSFDIVESYSGSPFLATGSDNFLDSHVSGGDHPGEYKRLNGQAEGFGYEDLGND